MGATLINALQEHVALFQRLPTLSSAIEHAAQAMAECFKKGGKLMFCGNGGSAAEAQHLAAEFVGRFEKERRPFAAIALTDPVTLSAIANDYGYSEAFARQVSGIGRPGDVLVCISTSGHSGNIFAAAKAARDTGIAVIGLLGRDGGIVKLQCDTAIVVPCWNTARIQEAHTFISHVLCGLVEEALQ